MLVPPLLVSYSTLDEYINALPHPSKAEINKDKIDKDKVEELYKKSLPIIVSYPYLATLFGFSQRFIISMCHNNKNYYRTFTIKIRKKRRLIYAPRVSLKVIQKWFGHHLANFLANDGDSLNDHIFGFVPGKSHLLAAQQHCESSWVYSVDIKDFFDSTEQSVVLEALLRIGYTKDVCNKIILPLCCYKDHLTQGSPSSPALSNLAMKELVDKKLINLANKYKITFTRYADDIVFSGTNEFPNLLKNEIRNIFEYTCWKLAESKTYFARSSENQGLKVHGLLVHNKEVRLSKRYRNKIRAYKHLWDSDKIKTNQKRLAGHINYSKSIDNLT